MIYTLLHTRTNQTVHHCGVLICKCIYYKSTTFFFIRFLFFFFLSGDCLGLRRWSSHSMRLDLEPKGEQRSAKPYKPFMRSLPGCGSQMMFTSARADGKLRGFVWVEINCVCLSCLSSSQQWKNCIGFTHVRHHCQSKHGNHYSCFIIWRMRYMVVHTHVTWFEWNWIIIK